MPIKKRIIEKSLRGKGFIEENSHHQYFHLEVDGKLTGISTYTSHGSASNDVGDSILKMMKRQLRLQSMKHTKDFLECPISGDEYIQILREQGDLN